MGRRTFGKGSVQTILPMNNKAAIKITTARYFTPNGRSIQAEWIKPDIVIDRVRVEAAESAGPTISEARLEGHLGNPNGSTRDAGKPPAEPSGTPAGEQDDAPTGARLAREDYDVYEALNLLKGMVLLKSRGGSAGGG
jgi:carboxyl-terminal processing protease